MVHGPRVTVANARAIAFESSRSILNSERYRVLRFPGCPVEVVEEIFLASNVSGILRSAAIHPSMTENFIRKVIDDKNPLVTQGSRDRQMWHSRVTALMHSSLFPGELLHLLYKQGYFRQAIPLLKHVNLPTDLMTEIIDFSFVTGRSFPRETVAANPSLPQPLVLRLLVDEEWKVLRSLAQNTGVDAQVLWPLLQSRSVPVLNALSYRFEDDEREIVLNRLDEVSQSAVARKAIAGRTKNVDRQMAAVIGGDSLALRSALRNPHLVDEVKVAYQLSQGV